MKIPMNANETQNQAGPTPRSEVKKSVGFGEDPGEHRSSGTVEPLMMTVLHTLMTSADAVVVVVVVVALRNGGPVRAGMTT